MDDPVKLIYKYKNLNNRIQYELFIFVGFYVDEGIKKTLEWYLNNKSYYSLLNKKDIINRIGLKK